MSKVILDSWGISNFLFAASKNEPLSTYFDDPILLVCHQNLLNALVLWDDIYLNADLTSSCEFFTAEHCIHDFHDALGHPPFIHVAPIDLHWYNCEESAQKFAKAICNIPHHILSNEKLDTSNNCGLRELLFRGYLYVIHSNHMGISYLPHPFRAEFLSESGIFSRKLDALTYLGIVDKEITDYINTINKLAQSQLLLTPFPVLFKFIMEMAKDTLDEFTIALELRKDKNIVSFRESVSEICKEVEKGNIHALRASLMKAKEVCDDISNSLYRRPIHYGVTVALSPSIEISSDGKPKVRSGFHTTFLSDMANYGLKGIIPGNYLESMYRGSLLES